MTQTLIRLAPPPKLPAEWPDMTAVIERQPDAVKMDGLNHLQVEMTNICNLKCVECPQRLLDRSYANQWMMPATFEAVLDLLGRYRFETIIPHKDGESLLYPFIREAIRDMARLHEGKFTIYTNGTCFTEEFYQFARSLPNTFEIFISFHFVGFASNRAEEERLKEYDCDPAGAVLERCLEDPAENIRFAISTHQTKYVERSRLDTWKAYWDEVAERRPQLTGVHLNTNINPWAGHIPSEYGTVSFPVCPYGDASHMFIGVTGNVLPCCMDLNEELYLGNILTDDIEEIMENRRRFYWDVARAERRKPRCVTCLSGAAA